jgi:hypothetical protein
LHGKFLLFPPIYRIAVVASYGGAVGKPDDLAIIKEVLKESN